MQFIRRSVFIAISQRERMINMKSCCLMDIAGKVGKEQQASSSAVTAAPIGSPQSQKIKKISRAMRIYIEKSKEHEEHMKKEIEEFELGKRHLANMMGVDANSMTQADIDKAIEYLLPSGIFSLKARPVMKHPELLWPQRKPAEFDEGGRPFHHLFYTLKPNFYQILSEAAEKIRFLQSYEDKQYEKGFVEPEQKLNLLGTEWIKKDALEKLAVERIQDDHYAQFLAVMEHLVAQPYSYVQKDFLMKFRAPIKSSENQLEMLPEKAEYDEKERKFAKAIGTRKHCTAEVFVYEKGTGKFLIDNQKLDDLWMEQSREILLFPFILLEILGKFDVVAKTTFGGHYVPPFKKIRHRVPGGESAKAGAIRLAICRALTVLLPKENMEKMRLAGLLTRDPRRRERTKWAQKGARAKWTWKKR